MEIRNTSECKVTIFYEDNHRQAETVKALNSLLPFFKEQNFKTVCFETHITNKADALQLFKSSAEENTLLSKVAMDAEAREKASNFSFSERARIKTIEELDENDMQYCGMDMHTEGPTSLVTLLLGAAKRSKHMADIIKESCQTGNVLVLTGVGHIDIPGNLINKGLIGSNIKGYYTPDLPKRTDNFMYKQQKLRTEDSSAISTYDGILTIDLFKDSSLDPYSIISQDYSNYLLGEHSQVEL